MNLTVYDISGRKVTTLVNEEREAGIHEVTFDATGLASGMYLYRLTAGDYMETKRLTYVK